MNKLKQTIPTIVAFFSAILISLCVFENILIMLIGLLAIITVFILVSYYISTNPFQWGKFSLKILPATVFVAMLWSSLPLRIVFTIYQAEFEANAEIINAGASLTTPFWIGPFKIKMAGRRSNNGTPYLAINSNKWEINGFVQHPTGQGFNLWSCITLDDKWSFITED